MSRDEKKLSGAMRLFEALSGVEEELLAKADETKEETAIVKKTKILAFSGSKGRLAASLAVAASLFLVVGAVWSGAPMLNGKKSAETETVTIESWTGKTTADSAAEVTEKLADEAFGVDVEETVEEEMGEKRSEAQKHTQKSESEIAECIGSMAPDDRLELSEEQARAAEVLGAYIPSNIPKGYVWESAHAAVNDETGEYESVFVCWTKGMDSIMITVSMVDANSLVLTDITKKETYDVSLYDIPYADTVPEEYRLCFDNPIFTWEDMSLELVQSRMKVVADAGDTDTPRGNFSVVYPEGILLDFNGDGTAEEIWKMLR